MSKMKKLLWTSSKKGFVNLRNLRGSTACAVAPQDTICTLESVKAVGEVYAPVDLEEGLGLKDVESIIIWVVCQNYGPLLGTLNIRFRSIIGIQKGSIILTSTHIPSETVMQVLGFDGAI